MNSKVSREDAQEIQHKLTVLSESPDLQESYELTEQQANELARSVPMNGGEWRVPAWGVAAVRGELRDHCEVLADIASGARSDGQRGQALRISKQAKRLRELCE